MVVLNTLKPSLLKQLPTEVVKIAKASLKSLDKDVQSTETLLAAVDIAQVIYLQILFGIFVQT